MGVGGIVGVVINLSFYRDRSLIDGGEEKLLEIFEWQKIFDFLGVVPRLTMILFGSMEAISWKSLNTFL